MASEAETRICRLSAMCGLLAAMTFVVPRFFPNPEGGFAGGANAIVALLAMLVVTLLVSLYLLAVTLKAYPHISMRCRVLGIGPSVLLGLVLIAFFGLLRY